MNNLVCFNGELISLALLPLSIDSNRAFLYADGIFETMKFSEKKILFFEDHLERLSKGMKYFEMIPHDFLQADSLKRMIIELCEKSNISQGRIRLQVWRNSQGLYSPESDETYFVIAAKKISERKYSLNDKGLNTVLYSELKKSTNKLENHKTINCHIQIKAAQYCKSNGVDDCFLLNTDGNISEAVSSNVFIVKNGVLLTPALDQGCVDGVMRKQIIRSSKEIGIECLEKAISIHDTKEADEVFLTNVIAGIQWVKTFEGKNYSTEISALLVSKLNEKSH